MNTIHHIGRNTPGEDSPTPARPYTEQYVALPPDVIEVFKEEHGYVRATPASLRADGVTDPAAIADTMRKRKTSHHGGGRMAVRDLHLLAALYRLANQTTWRVYTTPAALAAASGWSLRALQDRYRSDGNHPLREWVTLGDRENGHWEFILDRVADDDFIKVPAWWLWSEPAPDADTRFVCRMEVGNPALLAALTVSRVADYRTQSTNRYGAQGFATLAGVSLRTMKKGLAEADRLGMVAITRRGGGRVPAVYTVRHRPADVMSDWPAVCWLPGPNTPVHVSASKTQQRARG